MGTFLMGCLLGYVFIYLSISLICMINALGEYHEANSWVLKIRPLEV